MRRGETYEDMDVWMGVQRWGWGVRGEDGGTGGRENGKELREKEKERLRREKEEKKRQELAKKAAEEKKRQELAKKAESYEICFVPDNDYRGFLKRKVPGLEEQVAGGDFIDLKGNVLGILGLGKQGKQVARFGNAFSMNVIAWSHNLTKEICDLEKVTLVSSDEMFKISDVLSIHTKLSERTRGFIDYSKIQMMKKTAIIINTSRGPIINEKDLINSIKNHSISGVGLDVYDVEPLPEKHEFRELSKNYNVVLTPHLGYVSSETYEKFHQGYVDAIQSYINGKPINVLN